MSGICYRHRIVTLALAGGVAAMAAGAALGQSADILEGYLVRQDSSDCQNSNVSASDPNLVGGTIQIAKVQDGSLALTVGITVQPKTRYNFFLKCVRQLGILETSDEGSAVNLFTIPPGQGGNPLTFDMYPDGAPAGNKFQSTPVKF